MEEDLNPNPPEQSVNPTQWTATTGHFTLEDAVVKLQKALNKYSFIF